MSLRHSYSVLAPVYDRLVGRALHKARQRSLARLHVDTDLHILVNGVGTGLDIPLLPLGPRYTGTDLTPAMLRIAQRRADDSQHAIQLQEADSMQLPYDDATFDHIVMHLILAVVPDPERALQEAYRVLKAGGRIYILDKFLKPGELALLRRCLNVVTRHIATRTDVVFEDVLKTVPGLKVTHDKPALAAGWFRLIECEKTTI